MFEGLAEKCFDAGFRKGCSGPFNICLDDLPIRVDDSYEDGRWSLDTGPCLNMVVSRSIWEELKVLPKGFTEVELMQAFRRGGAV